MKKYIAYYRVSTREQGDSGLGLRAQKQAVKRHIDESDILVKEFEEIESGKKSDRPQLLKAIEVAKENGATLIIAKLDRLSRNAKFIFTLRDSGVKFICADMPEANSLTIGLLSVLAEEEAKRISERTSSALAQIKNKIESGEKHISKNGNVVKKLGSPQNLTDEVRKAGRDSYSNKALNNPENKRAGAFIVSLKEQGLTYYAITEKLNESGFKTSRGNDFNQMQVKRLYKRYKNK